MMRLTVVTPERAFIDAEVHSVTLPGKMGEMQVLEGHIGSLIELKAGIVTFEDAAHKVIRFMVGSGFAEINSHEVNVMSEIARYREEVSKEHELALQRDLSEQLIKLQDRDEKEISEVKMKIERNAASLNLLE